MRKIQMTLAAAVVAIGLGGCAGGDSLPSVTTPQVQNVIDTIKNGAVKACGYAPAFQTVLDIIGTFSSGVAPISDSVDAIVNGICGAVTAKSAVLRGGSAPVYRGVVLKGTFVK